MRKMTEQEWLTTTNPYDLTHYKACRSERKRRLLSCAFARRVLFLIPDDRYQQAVEIAERYADGVVTEEEMRATRRVMNKAWNERQFMEAGNHAATAVLATLNKEAVGTVASWEAAAAARGSLARPNWDRGSGEEKHMACVLARDVFGNPFRPVAIDPAWIAWNDNTVVKIAKGIYEDRAFDRLPILADALEDAGCQAADILGHCRHAGPHVRGCWVVDLLTGRI
jgi:hypothetical protein